MDRYFYANREFSRCYIDDVVIYLKTGDKHVKYLRTVLTLFKDRNLLLGPTKIWLGYDNVELLGFYINGFGYLNTKECLAALVNLQSL